MHAKQNMYFVLLPSVGRKMAMWKYLKAPKDGLSDPRGSWANEILSRAIEQANQEVCHLTAKESKGSMDLIGVEIKITCVMCIDTFS